MKESLSEDQVILINKPLQWTSFDVVKKIRHLTKIKKIGHAGTLDPLASGLLILCTGKMTKQIETFQGQKKEYVGKMMLGQVTPSCDSETEVTKKMDIDHISETRIRQATAPFTGIIQQSPPLYSAIKVDGQRAYKLARAGSQMILPPREVTIYDFEIDTIHLPEISFKVSCSKGVYIRSLVRDFGEALGVGAYLSKLCRTKIGDFSLKDAVTIEHFIR